MCGGLPDAQAWLECIESADTYQREEADTGDHGDDHDDDDDHGDDHDDDDDETDGSKK